MVICIFIEFRLSEFVPLAKRLTEDRDILSKRLATAGSDLMHFHEELNKRRQKMDILTNRLDSVCFNNFAILILV